MLTRGLKVHSLYLLYVSRKENGLVLMDLIGHLNKSGIQAQMNPQALLLSSQLCEHCQHEKEA